MSRVNVHEKVEIAAPNPIAKDIVAAAAGGRDALMCSRKDSAMAKDKHNMVEGEATKLISN